MPDNTTILYISHGGGPLPILGDPDHQEMINTLQSIPQQIATPTAIVVISAHWEEQTPTITGGTKPPLIYDYYGFPEESYSITYPCPGEPGLASHLADAMNTIGIQAKLDMKRGFDHGLLIPLKIMYPEADIPCIQISLMKNLAPEAHINLGEAIKNHLNGNILVIGSGFSFHNMREFFADEDEEKKKMNVKFDSWLQETCSSSSFDEEQRKQMLVKWESAPHARHCHPREEHLLPLHVCYGIANRKCDQMFSLDILKKDLACSSGNRNSKKSYVPSHFRQQR